MKQFLSLALCCTAFALPACSQNQSMNAQSAPVITHGSYVRNGDFEKVDNGSLANWTVSGNAKPEAVSGVWKTLTTKFKSSENKTVAFYFWVPNGASGSVWIDNLRVGPNLTLNNPSFEDTGADSALSGWGQDNKNVTVFSDDSRASDGNKSVRITHASEFVPATQIWQDFQVEPNKDYSLSFDIFVGDDFQGEAKGWLFNAAHNTSIDFETENLLGSKLVADRDRAGRFDAILKPTANAPAELSQEVVVPPNANLQASLDLENSAFQGAVKLVVEDAASGRVLRETELTKTDAKWQTLNFSFQSVAPRVRVRVSATGAGTLHVDNLALTPPQIVPALQKVQWLSAADDFVIPTKLQVSVAGKVGVAMDGALALLQKDLQPHGVTIEKKNDKAAPLQILIGANYAVKGKGDEAYSLDVDGKQIVIKAGTESGAFYGVMTLLQLIDKRNNAPVFLPCKVMDYPDLPLRGFLYADAEQAARWKLNTLMVSTGYLVSDDEKKLQKKLVDETRRLNLDFIPYFMSLQGGYYVEGINPNLAAGVAVQDEKITLRGVEPSDLANPYVIRTGLTDVKLTSADGKTNYVTGKDYQVIDGEMKYNYDNPNAKRFAVARLPGSSIPDGSTLLAAYDYVSHVRQGRSDVHITYAPMEPEARKLTDDYMTQLAAAYDFNFIHSSSDLHEFFLPDRQLETDSRVIKSGKKPIELMVEEAHFQNAAIKRGNPKTRPFQWTGDVGEYAKAAAPHLPKDSLVNIWGYDSNWPAAYGREAIEYWSKLGYETSVMPWDNLRNIGGWAQVVKEARAKGLNCQGIIGSGWEGRPTGLKETASVAWKIPGAGDKNYVALPKEK